MIPPKVIRFLNESAYAGFAGTCTRNLEPAGYRVSGWHADADGRRLTVLIPDPFAEPLVQALQENAKGAFTFEELSTAETYQLKGTFVGHRPVTPSEVASVDQRRERFARYVGSLLQDERVTAIVASSIARPVTAVEIEVLEVYVQTPGPGAGARISPAPEGQASHA